MGPMKIGLMLPLGEDDVLGRPFSVAHLLDMAVAADESGLDSVWAADHLLFRHDDGRPLGIHECWTLLAAVAARTQRVEIGPLVLAVPFRNPAVTAKMATTMDELSGGRFVLGIGCGWYEPEFDAFDIPFDHRVGRFEEALQVMLPMVRDGSATFDGRWHAARDAMVAPRGPRPNGPPVLIAGKGPRMMRLVARHADAWNAAWYGPPSEAADLRQRIENLHRACADEGRDPATIALTAGVFVGFPHLPADGGEAAPDRAMSGDVEAVAGMLAGYHELGLSELMVHLWPNTVAGVVELGRAAARARELST
jgi:probable F420-dependent oxidoreductase